MAGWATPGINIGSFDLMPKRLREWATTWAVSPIAKISGWSGTDRSEFTMILPDLSVAEFIHRPAGEARTPAPQSTVDKLDRKSTRLNSSHQITSYAVFCLKKKQNQSVATIQIGNVTFQNWKKRYQ